MKHYDRSNLGREGFIQLTFPHHSSSSGQELKQNRNLETWRSTSHWLGPHALFSLFSYRPQDQQPRMAPPTMGWALSNHSLIEKMPPQACLQPHLTEAFSQRGSPLSDDVSLCHIDIKLCSMLSIALIILSSQH